MKRLHWLVIIASASLLILFSLTAFTVSQGHGALVLRLGELRSNAKTGKADVYQPGLHFKSPLLNDAILNQNLVCLRNSHWVNLIVTTNLAYGWYRLALG